MNILVLQSGGTTPVINATLAGVLMGGNINSKPCKIYTALNGVYGAINGEIKELDNDKSFAKSIIDIPGSSITGTSRVGFLDEQNIFKLYKSLKNFSIDALINIGGNGTLQQSKSIAETLGGAISIASCPKTVDNDLGDKELNNVFFTPGFPSCINWWNKHLNFLNIENLGAYTHDQVLVAQTFGRDTGFITAGCDNEENFKDILVYGIPESGITLYELEEEVKKRIETNKRCIVLITEGLFSDKLTNLKDLAGQEQYSSGESTSAQFFSNYLNKKGINSRSIIPTSFQRVFSSEVIEYDKEVAFAEGFYCVKSILEGEKEFLVSISSKKPEEIINLKYTSLPKNYSRKLDPKYIHNHRPSDSYKEYINSLSKLDGIYNKLLRDNVY